MCKINICYNPKYNHNQMHDTKIYRVIGDITTSERRISSTERKVTAISREPYHGRCKWITMPTLQWQERIVQYCDIPIGVAK